jgi:hypothetical protein
MYLDDPGGPTAGYAVRHEGAGSMGGAALDRGGIRGRRNRLVRCRATC